MLGHLYMSKKLWNLSPKFLFNIRISIQLNASLAYICYLIFLAHFNYLWFFSAIILVALGLCSTIYLLADKQNRKPVYKHYLIYLHLISFITFLFNYFDLPLSSYTTNLMFISFVGPFFWFFLKDFFTDLFKKKNKKPTQAILPKEPMTLTKRIIDWGNILVFYAAIMIGLGYGINILQLTKFLIIWSVICVLFLGLAYYILKTNKAELLNLISETVSYKNAFGRVFSLVLLICASTMISGILLTRFVEFDNQRSETVEVVEHGAYKKKSSAFITIRYRGWKKDIRPSSEEWDATIKCDSITLLISNRLFGVDYLKGIEACKKEK